MTTNNQPSNQDYIHAEGVDPADVRSLLTREWENYRYQDTLRWSRIQNVGVIEAALLAGVYSNILPVAGDPHGYRRLAFAVVMSMLVGVFCALSEKDGRDANVHAARAESIEVSLKLGTRPRAKWVLGVRGHYTLRIAMFLVLGLNAFVIADLIRGIVLHLLHG
jgi:hypothetical protein